MYTRTELTEEEKQQILREYRENILGGHQGIISEHSSDYICNLIRKRWGNKSGNTLKRVQLAKETK